MERFVYAYIVGAKSPGLLASLGGVTLPDLGLHL